METDEAGMPLRIVKWGLIGIAALVCVLVVAAFFLPSRYSVERSVVIDASAVVIHPLVSDLRRWPEWGPWQEDDPTRVVTLGDKVVGAGASQTWKGAGGSGSLEITRSEPAWGIAYDIMFNGEFPAKAEIRYEPRGEKTRVVWRIRGEVGWDLLARYFALAMDAMVGPMFELGLEKLEEKVEGK